MPDITKCPGGRSETMDADDGWKRVRDLESALHKISAIAIQDVSREFVWLSLDKIATIAKEALI